MAKVIKGAGGVGMGDKTPTIARGKAAWYVTELKKHDKFAAQAKAEGYPTTGLSNIRGLLVQVGKGYAGYVPVAEKAHKAKQTARAKVKADTAKKAAAAAKEAK